ncbi:SDR family oxidoreductase [Mucilaginibacter gynuensis]|uniref:SDR family oxidoreductase n=1 Tax=Mucilaginibacter gynuensis TaxID=1302236 RepID=A0ABP8GFU3_9SPHI
MKNIIVITGTSTGFGSLMVKTFAAEGNTVIATMRGLNGKNAEAGKSLAKLDNVEVLELDVADDESVRIAIGEVLKKHGRIDVLINNAAIQGSGLLEAYSLEQVQKIFNVNVFGVLRLYREVLPAMRLAKNGLIINITSNAGRFSPPFQVPYNASKFAVEGISEGGYDELLQQGIETVIIEPGAFLTEIYSKEGTHADRAGILEAYGDATIKQMAAFSEKLGAAMMKHQPNPIAIAEAALNLVRMPKGERPLRTPVDPIADGVDLEYDRVTSEIKGRWVAKYLS